MKKFLTLFAMAALVMTTGACNKNTDPAEIAAVTLSVTPASAVIDADSDDIALTFNWNDVATASISPVYSFQITQEGDSDFANGTSYECNGTTKAFSHAEIAALASEIGASLDKGFTLAARVRVTDKTADSKVAPVLSNVVTAAVSKTQYPIEDIFPIGEATPYGWSTDKTEPMAKSGAIYTWTGHLYANAEFKFLLQRDWWPGIVNKTTDPFTYDPVIGMDDSVDRKFKVDKEGKYTITIDASNTNDLKMTVTFIDDDVQTLEVNELYILGGAVATGWSLDDMEAFTKDGNVFTWEGFLNPGEFRFPMQKESGVWWPCLMVKEDGKTIVKGNGDGDKIIYSVEEPGTYRIVVNVETMTCEITLIAAGGGDEAEIETLYILGGATDTGWSLDDMASFAKDGNIFTWTGNLKAGEEFRFPLQKDWWPCLMIDMDGVTLKKGFSDNDKTGYTVATTGVYKIVCNVKDMTVEISAQ
ncbi:MAG: SusF/SusE family outer membrane protein [Bacteroidales bacterium]|nr:SusF/SusE family outer membrane protein [Bacteroidales bacterium]